ncbi:MAG: hypothetical protein CMP59_10325 [Flavobacteriales bacterium]|nr:hypothetical protein [Flavobacteriales bacterium]
MKKIGFLLFMLAAVVGAKAQTDEGCHERYVKVFEVRGADEVEDGLYADVVITLRKGTFEDCFIGKVKVENGMVLRNSIALTFVDGSYEQFVRNYKNKEPVKIINGMSETMITEDDELINVLFIGSIKPKKKAYKRAPMPSSL